ncbi:MAG: LytTR family DNA-binding domain-containing protein, partial [Bacteroidota bacterium]|nr:LytTR family DNA-binding domain-containing protein [Bacteroidota bacterium]
TAYEKYALEGFKLNAIDYLLKPFSYEEFLKAAQKARKQAELEVAALPTIEANSQFLFLKSEYKIRRINFNDILYIEGLKDYIKVYTTGEDKPVLSLNSMKSLEQKLPENKFMRVHRSFIVNLDRIETIERSRIIFGKTYIPVSDQYKDKFQEYLDKNFL